MKERVSNKLSRLQSLVFNTFDISRKTVFCLCIKLVAPRL